MKYFQVVSLSKVWKKRIRKRSSFFSNIVSSDISNKKRRKIICKSMRVYFQQEKKNLNNSSSNVSSTIRPLAIIPNNIYFTHAWHCSRSRVHQKDTHRLPTDRLSRLFTIILLVRSFFLRSRKKGQTGYVNYAGVLHTCIYISLQLNRKNSGKRRKKWEQPWRQPWCLHEFRDFSMY